MSGRGRPDVAGHVGAGFAAIPRVDRIGNVMVTDLLGSQEDPVVFREIDGESEGGKNLSGADRRRPSHPPGRVFGGGVEIDPRSDRRVAA